MDKEVSVVEIDEMHNYIGNKKTMAVYFDSLKVNNDDYENSVEIVV